MTCRVAVVGTEGTGKTVLMTVWAKAFLRKQRGISLIPQTKDTALFLTKNWEYLAQGDWPPSTRGGSLVQLKWELKIPNSAGCHVEFREISGQDFRYLFGDSAVDQVESLPKQLRDLVDNLERADICILLVNLADFAGESDIDTKEKSQWAVKYSLDWIFASGAARQCLILFTQADLYSKLQEELGSWKEVAKKYLPYVYTSHIATGKVDVLAVSAVGNTRVVFAEDGTPRRVPDTQWHCRGLFAMTEWIGRCAVKHAARQNKRSSTPDVAREASPRVDAIATKSLPVVDSPATASDSNAPQTLAASSSQTTESIRPAISIPTPTPADEPTESPERESESVTNRKPLLWYSILASAFAVLIIGALVMLWAFY